MGGLCERLQDWYKNVRPVPMETPQSFPPVKIGKKGNRGFEGHFYSKTKIKKAGISFGPGPFSHFALALGI